MNRPAFSRRTVLVWVLLLVAVAALVQTGRPPDDSHDGHGHAPAGLDELPEGRFPVFTFGEPDMGSVTIAWKGRHVDFGRDPQGRWIRTVPAHDHAHDDHAHDDHAHDDHAHDDHAHDDHAHDDHGQFPGDGGMLEPATIAEQFEVSARMLADRAIVPDRPLEAYGLHDPGIVFRFRDRLNGDPLAVLQVGDLLVTGYAYYAMLERRPGRLLLIPRYQVNLLLALAFGDEAPALVPRRPEDRDAGAVIPKSRSGRAAA